MGTRVQTAYEMLLAAHQLRDEPGFLIARKLSAAMQLQTILLDAGLGSSKAVLNPRFKLGIYCCTILP